MFDRIVRLFHDQTFDPKLTVTALFASVPNYEENEPLPRYAFDLLV